MQLWNDQMAANEQVSFHRGAAALNNAVNIEDMRQLARRRLPRSLFEFIDGGAGDEVTLRDNCAAFGRWSLRPRAGVNVATRILATDILGAKSTLPLIVGPTGLAGFFHRDGEVGIASASAAAGLPFCLSANSVASIEETARGSPSGERWFQIYFLKDRDWMNSLVRRARESGYRVLCITVDLPITGRREKDIRNGFTVPLRPSVSTALDLAAKPAWLMDMMRTKVRFGNFETAQGSGFSSVAEHVASLFDPGADWDDVARLRDSWNGPVVVKGVLRADDARRAASLGADAIAVSNHGGRQLDGSPAALSALPEIVAEIGSSASVYLDGGIRRGTDIVKALALGADACMIGRASAWGLSAGGTAGVMRALAILRDELDNALALLGVANAADIGIDAVCRAEASRSDLR
jgi:isopentenyl diphosphate isomerase/L-lactate dehydrogenase-like FMN-dependent dehydrogenase